MTRGIVIPAGGVVLLNHAWATIKVCMTPCLSFGIHVLLSCM